MSGTNAEETTTAATAPVFTVVHGNPTDEELAIVVAVLAARSGGGDADGSVRGGRPHSRWNDPARAVRPSVYPSPGGWRASALPPTR